MSNGLANSSLSNLRGLGYYHHGSVRFCKVVQTTAAFPKMNSKPTDIGLSAHSQSVYNSTLRLNLVVFVFFDGLMYLLLHCWLFPNSPYDYQDY